MAERTDPTPEEIEAWLNDESVGGPEFGPYVAGVRDLLDLVAGTSPPPEVLVEATRRLDELNALLEPWQVSEGEPPVGRRPDLPGRGHPMLLPLVMDERSDDRIRGRVVFRRVHLGGGGAAHGGTPPLLFDEVLGVLANVGGRPRARTAYLHVNYRSITPIGVELTIEAQVDREEGRKRWISGRLLNGDVLVADAEGLFLQLRPGQP